MHDGKCSSWLNITSGVHQGSILRPLFFVIFISDLPEVVTQESTVALYADDCKAFRVVTCANDQLMFQGDLGSLYVGSAVASWLVRSTLERAVRVRALAGDIVLCSWARHFTLNASLHPGV